MTGLARYRNEKRKFRVAAMATDITKQVMVGTMRKKIWNVTLVTSLKTNGR
jgi:hypothetical protein